MDIKTETFGTITAKAFAVAGGYIKRVSARLKQEFEVVLVYGAGAVFATGDATHINKYLPALVLAGLEAKFRKVIVNHNIIPFAYDNKVCQFTGKINVGRRADLEMIVNGCPQWETLLRAALDGAKPENNTKAFVLEAKLTTLVKGLRGLTIQPSDNDVLKLLRAALKDNPKVAPKAEVQEVKGAIDREDATIKAAERAAAANAVAANLAKNGAATAA